MAYKYAAFAAAALLAASPAFAEDWDFVLTNSTGKGIKTFEISPAGANKWQANKVDPEMKREPEVKNGGRTTIHFDKEGSQCKYDLKATFGDGGTAVWSGINICDAAYVTIKYANDTATFTVS
jgi:hypothetical protein